jgi:hypothetical protein
MHRFPLTDRLDKVLSLWMPKIELFYARFEPDMWVKSIDDFEEAYRAGDMDVTYQALSVLEYRRKKMVDIYRAFTELTQESMPQNPVIEAILKNLYAGADENTKRKCIACDSCGATAAMAKQLRIVESEEMNVSGDPQMVYVTTCGGCMAGQEESA